MDESNHELGLKGRYPAPDPEDVAGQQIVTFIASHRTPTLVPKELRHDELETRAGQEDGTVKIDYCDATLGHRHDSRLESEICLLRFVIVC